MLNEKIAKLINEQVNKELYSGYLYLDFANYYAAEGLDGFEHWYEVQAQEERDHAMMMRLRRHSQTRQEIRRYQRAAQSGTRARAIRYLAYKQHLRRSVRTKRFQDNAVPRLVH